MPKHEKSIERSRPAPKSERLTLHPLTPEDALGGFMQVDPKRVAEKERRERQKGKKRGKAGG